MKIKRIVAGAVMAVLASTTMAASAQAASVVFNDFGAGFASNCCTGWTVSTAASAVSTDFNSASGFVSPGEFDVSQIDVGISNVTGLNAVDISLWTNVGDTLGAQLGTWHVTGLPNFGSSDPVVTIGGISGVQVHSGQGYFLLAQASKDTWDAWNWNSNGVTGTRLLNGSPSYGDTLGAFDVLGNATAAVPEPATWATMLTGFVGLGAAMRRRRRVSATA